MQNVFFSRKYSFAEQPQASLEQLIRFSFISKITHVVQHMQTLRPGAKGSELVPIVAQNLYMNNAPCSSDTLQLVVTILDMIHIKSIQNLW